MNSGTMIPADTIAGMISIYWYIGSMVTITFYGFIVGAVIDSVRKL